MLPVGWGIDYLKYIHWHKKLMQLPKVFYCTMFYPLNPLDTLILFMVYIVGYYGASTTIYSV